MKNNIAITVFALCILVFANHSLFGQTNFISRNNIYLEAGGAAFFYSINYERLLYNNQQKNITARMGILYFPTLNASGRTLKGIPISASYLKRIRKHFLEGGLSFAAIVDHYNLNFESNIFDNEVKELIIIPSLRIGIRRQPQIKGLFWNVLFQTSYIAVDDFQDFKFRNAEKSIIPFLSVGVGHAF